MPALPGSSSMQREQLLNLLDQQARDAFEGAKRIALANGGIVTPLQWLPAFCNHQASITTKDLSSLLSVAREAITTRYPEASESITVSKETQTTISEAGQLAQLDGCARATPAHLLRAALRSQTVKLALGELARFEQIAEALAANTAQAASGDRQSGSGAGAQTTADRASQPAEESSRPGRALTGALE